MTYEAAFITGASSGLGRALARELSRRGAFVYVLGRRGELLGELVAELERSGPGGVSLPCDVRDSAALEGAMRAADADAMARGRPIDLVIANAGVAEISLDREAPVAAIRQVLEVNAVAAVATIEVGRMLMGPRRRGHLCGISSLAGVRGLPGAASYSASKAALSVHIEGLRFDLKREGLSITDVQPGFVRTPMTDLNRFRMPFLMDADVAARRVVRALEKRRMTYRFPKRLAWPMRLLAGLTPQVLWAQLPNPPR